MSPFWTYTLSRIGLFAVTYGVLAGIGFGFGLVKFEELTNLVVLFVAMVISSVLAFVLLTKQREALALQVQERAEKISARIEESRSAEDVD
ncbi:DUF4229 domain-containing protein [Aeromicrobium sp. Leaf350]|uniref:DUF4229 domain-containing protein n=1 Tax=Aeromicrobium sp. Leaf350 TaxID=2876565 RepID=UPI001E3F9507|nr:DUF4229 domain-containing protein [Aeromicrobium sp. Leaf350]